MTQRDESVFEVFDELADAWEREVSNILHELPEESVAGARDHLAAIKKRWRDRFEDALLRHERMVEEQ